MTNKSTLLLIFTIAMLCLAIGWMTGSKTKPVKNTKEETANGMVSKIEKVFKLVATEGNVSEIYDYKEYNYYDIPLFRKKMLIRVNAKVLVGYDFENAHFSIDEANRIITLDSLLPPQVLAIDHDLDYYDIQEGAFNSFTEKEMTELAEKAKEFAIATAEDSDLFNSAEEQKKELFEMISLACLAMGWEFKTSTTILPN